MNNPQIIFNNDFPLGIRTFQVRTFMNHLSGIKRPEKGFSGSHAPMKGFSGSRQCVTITLVENEDSFICKSM
jgi:hypothetical protein